MEPSVTVSGNIRAAIIVGTLLVMVAGCTKPNEPGRYDRANTTESVTTMRGIVLSVRQVEVTGQKTGDNTTGNILGGAGGAVAGSAVGKGRGSLLGAILGVAAGVIATDKVQDLATAYQAFEYIVEVEAPITRIEGLDRDRKTNVSRADEKILRTVIQQEEKPLAVGARVFLIDGKDPRVIPDSSAQPQPKVDLSG